jgi:hypothetical protein
MTEHQLLKNSNQDGTLQRVRVVRTVRVVSTVRTLCTLRVVCTVRVVSTVRIRVVHTVHVASTLRVVSTVRANGSAVHAMRTAQYCTAQHSKKSIMLFISDYFRLTHTHTHTLTDFIFPSMLLFYFFFHFSSFRTPLLIATDVAARGLDIPQVEVRTVRVVSTVRIVSAARITVTCAVQCVNRTVNCNNNSYNE